MISTGQYCSAVPNIARTSAADWRNGSNCDMALTTPSTLAVIASKVSVRNRTRTSRAPITHRPLTMPAMIETAITAGMPWRRRLMMPVMPPT